MPLPTIPSGNVASATASTEVVTNSVRFNDGDSANMSRTSPDVTTTNDKLFTMSFWFKLGSPATNAQLFDNYSGSGSEFQIYLQSNGKIRLQVADTGNRWELVTTRVFRDPSAWYNVIISYDSTPSTPSASSCRMWVNGVLETAFDTAVYPTQNQDGHFGQQNHIQYIGRHQAGGGSSRYWDGYMAEVIGVDGQALINTDFGEYDEDSPTIWKPIDISGINVGALGFYMDFEDSSSLGNDVAGNGNFTENNIVAADQATDIPTNNFITLNPLDNYYTAWSFSEGNNKMTTGNSNETYTTSTVGLTKGLWYWEVKITAKGSNQNFEIGIASELSRGSSSSVWLGYHANNYGLYGASGNIYNGNGSTSASYGVAVDEGDIVGVFLDLEASKIYYAKDGTIMNSGTGFAITAVGSTINGFYLPAIGKQSGASETKIFDFNFGGCSAFTISSAVSDSNNIGNFEYSPNQGGASNFDGAAKNFLAICTKNLGSDG